MPYRWSDDHDELTLWPHRSMTNGGFVLFIGVTCGMLCVPLLAVLGSPVLWALLPFMAAAVGGLWIAIGRNNRDGALTEVLRFAGDTVRLVHRDPRRGEQSWEANPYWVTVHLDRGDKPVTNYLTLKGSGREVELGAFLSPDERKLLYGELLDRFGAAA